eukprot:11837507-Alexandrium_andersonii.AAC.1
MASPSFLLGPLRWPPWPSSGQRDSAYVQCTCVRPQPRMMFSEPQPCSPNDPASGAITSQHFKLQLVRVCLFACLRPCACNRNSLSSRWTLAEFRCRGGL